MSEGLVSDEKNIVKSVAKAFAVLQAFGPDTTELVLADVARAAGLDNAGAFRMLNTLVMLGYVERVPDTRRFRLTFKCLELGFNAIARADLRSLGRPLLRAIVGERVEAASIGVLDGHEVVYIARSNSPRVISIGFHVGARMPAHVVSPGYVIVSTFGEEALDAWIAGHDFAKFTPQTITTAEDFRAAVLKVREQGYMLVNQYIDAGLCGIAVPLVDRKGAPLGALSTTFQVQAWPGDSALAKLLPALQEAAQAIRAVV